MSRADRIALLCAALLAVGTLLRAALPALAGEAAAPLPDPAPVAAPQTLPPLDAFADVLQHNPFSPSRTAGAGAANQLGGAQLVGIVLSGSKRAALVRLADGTTKSIPPGGAVAGWTLVSLDKDHATLRRDAASTTLTLTRTTPR